MIKVLQSVHSIRAETGGPARSVPALAENLRAAGVEARLLVCEAPSDESFRNGLGGWRPELIHDHGLWLPTNHEAAAYARRQKLPLVISPRGMLEPWSLKHRRWKKRIAWALYQGRDLKSARLLHATSPQEAAQFRHLGFRQPIVVLPNGVTIPEDRPNSRESRNGSRTALFMSRIHPKKGLPLLIEAWGDLRPKGWKLRIVGPDEDGHATAIREMASAKGLSGDVSIEPAVDDRQKWNVLADCDLFILPTYSENFGIVVAEALAAGLPVITTTGTPWTTLNSAGCGWCVEPTSDGVREALRSAIGHSDDERRQMGARGRVLIEEQYSWSAIAESMRQAYEWVLGGGTPPECVETV